jgi:hypothetical protein
MVQDARLAPHPFKLQVSVSQDMDVPSDTHRVLDDSLSIILGSQYSPRSGPGLPLSGARRNCQVTLSLSVPAEWQFSVGGIEWVC